MKLQYFGHLMRRGDSLEKSLMLGKTESKWRRGQQRMRWLASMDMSLSKVWETVKAGQPGGLQSMALQRVGHNEATELKTNSYF